jgi:hypothetical protein
MAEFVPPDFKVPLGLATPAPSRAAGNLARVANGTAELDTDAILNSAIGRETRRPGHDD